MHHMKVSLQIRNSHPVHLLKPTHIQTQDINADHPLPLEFLHKILFDLGEASDISEHTYFTNNTFSKIVAQIINKTL